MGEYLVSGPGTEGRTTQSAPAAVSLAQGLAAKRDAPLGTWYVRRPDGTMGWHIVKEPRLITTTRLPEAPPRKGEAGQELTLEEAAA